MIIKFNLDGTIDQTYGSRIFKRSNAVTEILILAPFNSQSSILVNYSLPDGTIYTGVATYSGFSVDASLNMFKTPVTQSITEIAGRVDVSLEVRSIADSLEITTTANTHINVEASTTVVVVDDVDQYLTLANAGNVKAQTALDENVAQDILVANSYRKFETYSKDEAYKKDETYTQVETDSVAIEKSIGAENNAKAYTDVEVDKVVFGGISGSVVSFEDSGSAYVTNIGIVKSVHFVPLSENIINVTTPIESNNIVTMDLYNELSKSNADIQTNLTEIQAIKNYLGI